MLPINISPNEIVLCFYSLFVHSCKHLLKLFSYIKQWSVSNHSKLITFIDEEFFLFTICNATADVLPAHSRHLSCQHLEYFSALKIIGCKANKRAAKHALISISTSSLAQPQQDNNNLLVIAHTALFKVVSSHLAENYNFTLNFNYCIFVFNK